MSLPLIARPLMALAVGALVAGSAVAEVYRWKDDDGVTHYGDRPPPQGAERLETPGRRSQPATTRVREVIDGDTVILDDDTRLRLIGIDAPELPRRGQPGEPGAAQARAHLRRLLADVALRLEPGETRRDDYDRRLGYLMAGERDIGTRMLRDGWAVASLHEDNAGRAEDYFAAEAEAREAGRGLWGEPALQPVPAEEAATHRNSYRQLHGRVVAARAGRAEAELRLEGGLRLIVDEAARDRFSGEALRALEGEHLRARGVVRQRDGAPLLHLRHPAQIETR